MSTPDDDWLRHELEAMTLEELLLFRCTWDRYLRRRGRPRTGKGQAVHHINGDPHDNSIENLRLVDITANRRGKP